MKLRVVELTPENKSTNFFRGRDLVAGDCFRCDAERDRIEGRGQCWAIRLPGVGGMWHTNWEATGDPHAYWTVTGEPSNLTVVPSINIGPEWWHGHITDGDIQPEVDSDGKR